MDTVEIRAPMQTLREEEGVKLPRVEEVGRVLEREEAKSCQGESSLSRETLKRREDQTIDAYQFLDVCVDHELSFGSWGLWLQPIDGSRLLLTERTTERTESARMGASVRVLLNDKCS